MEERLVKEDRTYRTQDLPLSFGLMCFELIYSIEPTSRLIGGVWCNGRISVFTGIAFSME